MENGKMVGSMDLEFGKALRATHMLENGKITKLVEKDCISGKTGINMKENGKKVWNLAKVQINSQIKMFILVLTKMVYPMEVMDFIDGPLGHVTKENFWMQWRMEKENGKNKKDN